MTETGGHLHGEKARFCERCGTPLIAQELEGRLRPVCPACEFVVYRDPKVAAGVIITLNSEVVLLRRGIEPSLGKWVFPGGYVDVGEPTGVAAVREAKEEVGLDVEIEDLLGVYSYAGVQVVLVVYAGRVTGGEIQENFEAPEIQTFQISDIPWKELAFQSTGEALRDWVNQYQT